MQIFEVMMIAMALLLYGHIAHAQNTCSAANAQICAPYTCFQTDAEYSCICPNLQITQSAAACNNNPIVPTQPPIIPNQCGNAVCPANAVCIPTNQNPSQYVCLCPNNIIANPGCPTRPLANNPCTFNNPCLNGGTCAVDQLTLQAVCICPPNTYGKNCAQSCISRCANNWCYNGGRCSNAYGQAYCSCPSNYRGRRCELRYNPQNYVYLYYYPGYGK